MQGPGDHHIKYLLVPFPWVLGAAAHCSEWPTALFAEKNGQPLIGSRNHSKCLQRGVCVQEKVLQQ